MEYLVADVPLGEMGLALIEVEVEPDEMVVLDEIGRVENDEPGFADLDDEVEDDDITLEVQVVMVEEAEIQVEVVVLLVMVEVEDDDILTTHEERDVNELLLYVINATEVMV